MGRQRDEQMAAAREKRKRHQTARKARQPVASKPDDLATQVKDTARAAVAKVGAVVRSARDAIKAAVAKG